MGTRCRARRPGVARPASGLSRAHSFDVLLSEIAQGEAPKGACEWGSRPAVVATAGEGGGRGRTRPRPLLPERSRRRWPAHGSPC